MNLQKEKTEMEYREIKEGEIERSLFQNFERRQVVQKCWRKVDGQWTIQEDAFIDQWSEEDYRFLLQCLKNTVQTGGVVFGAFWNKQLKGFASVERTLFGMNADYMDLSSIHVSEDMRGHGVGTQLFGLACQWAKNNGAKKLYISAHSAVESQAFYKAMGCVEAKEYQNAHVEKEPYDCQLECPL